MFDTGKPVLTFTDFSHFLGNVYCNFRENFPFSGLPEVLPQKSNYFTALKNNNNHSNLRTQCLCLCLPTSAPKTIIIDNDRV